MRRQAKKHEVLCEEVSLSFTEEEERVFHTAGVCGAAGCHGAATTIKACQHPGTLGHSLLAFTQVFSKEFFLTAWRSSQRGGVTRKKLEDEPPVAAALRVVWRLCSHIGGYPMRRCLPGPLVKGTGGEASFWQSLNVPSFRRQSFGLKDTFTPVEPLSGNSFARAVLCPCAWQDDSTTTFSGCAWATKRGVVFS